MPCKLELNLFFSVQVKSLLLYMCNDLMRWPFPHRTCYFVVTYNSLLLICFLSQRSVLSTLWVISFRECHLIHCKTNNRFWKAETSWRERRWKMESELPLENTLVSEWPLDYNLYQNLWYLQVFFISLHNFSSLIIEKPSQLLFKRSFNYFLSLNWNIQTRKEAKTKT